MTFTLAISFPWGRYHGTPWGRNVNEGLADWPPEPWRIIRAMFATWKNRAPELDTEVVERTLGKLTGAPTYHVPDFGMAHTRHYLPDSKYKTDIAQSTDKVLDTFVVVHPLDEVRVTWHTDLADDEAEVLAILCDLLPYLGRAESLCEARLALEPWEPDGRGRTLEPGLPQGDGLGTQSLLTAAPPLDVQSVQFRPWELRRKGHIDPPGTLRVVYPAVAISPPIRRNARRRRAEVSAVRYRIVGKSLPSRTAVVSMTDVMRQAAMGRYGDLHGTREERPASARLSGKSIGSEPLATQHRHAHYLAFTAHIGPTDRDANHELLDTIVVWSPEPFDDADLDALLAVNRLRSHDHHKDFRACRLGVEAVGIVGNVAPELAGSSMVWDSYTPFIPPRHRKKRDEVLDHVLAEAQRELAHRGFPIATVSPINPGAASRPTTRGWLDFRRHRPSGRVGIAEAPLATGLRLQFEEAVAGPIVLGGLSHFGMGLFMPVLSTPLPS